MDTTKELYSLWLEKAKDDPDLKVELLSIKENDEEIYERFYREMEFGTAGLRGIIGAGTNRMNVYTVRRATQGLANYLNNHYENPSVAISYDSRIKGKLFSKESARVLAANGIKVYISTELQPTPVLSFAVRELNCQGGIMVTASHNPAAYNGYKAYGDDGCQMTDASANEVYSEIQSVDIFSGVKLMSFEQAMVEEKISYIDNSLYEKYMDNVMAQAVNAGVCNETDLKVVYTPLNGAGNKMVREALKRMGVKDVVVVKEQEMPDGNFTTCPYPNPEFREALQMGLDLSYKEQPDLLLATDPDSDRVGIAVKDGNSYRLISGNETGIMLTEYLLMCRKEQGTLPENPVVVRTIVSSILIDKICEAYGCQLKKVLTGFKYIGDQILQLEKKGEEERYVFGFEESYGYLVGTYVRDKDAVVASMLICEMAAYMKKQGKTLSQFIDSLYEKYGYYQNTTLNFGFEGAAGMEKMGQIMDGLRANPPKKIAGVKIMQIDDYDKRKSYDLLVNQEDEIDLPKSNVLAYSLVNGCSIIVRPSGTEPKIKLYITSVGKDKHQSAIMSEELAKAGKKLLGV